MIIPTQAHQVSELRIFTLRLKGERERFVFPPAATLRNAIFDLLLSSVVEIYSILEELVTSILRVEHPSETSVNLYKLKENRSLVKTQHIFSF